jgi:hypothetical protein
LAYKAHLALQDIDELGEFVEFVLPQETTDARDSRVIIRGGRATDLFRIQDHGAKLVDPKQSPPSSDAQTAVENRPSVTPLDH